MAFLGIFFYITIIALLCAEALIYPGVVQAKTGINPNLLFILLILVSIFTRLFTKKDFWIAIFEKSFYILGPAITFIAIVLRFIEQYTYPNYIYANFHIDPVQTGMLGLAFYVLSIPFIDKSIFKHTYKQFIVSASFALYHLFGIFWINPSLYSILIAEDGVIEYATMLFYLGGSILAVYSLKYVTLLSFSNKQKLWIKIVISLFAIGLFVIAAEEISWGQRIFNIDTPEHLKEVNTQKELTIHNNVHIFPYVYVIYFLVNLYGLLSWFGYSFAKKYLSSFMNFLIRLITTRWFLFVLFIPNLVYVLFRFYYVSGRFTEGEELSELYLAIAMCLWMFFNLAYIKHNTVKKHMN